MVSELLEPLRSSGRSVVGPLLEDLFDGDRAFEMSQVELMRDLDLRSVPGQSCRGNSGTPCCANGSLAAGDHDAGRHLLPVVPGRPTASLRALWRVGSQTWWHRTESRPRR